MYGMLNHCRKSESERCNSSISMERAALFSLNQASRGTANPCLLRQANDAPKPGSNNFFKQNFFLPNGLNARHTGTVPGVRPQAQTPAIYERRAHFEPVAHARDIHLV